MICCWIGAPEVAVVVPCGVVTLMAWGSEGSVEHSILYPGGRKVLKPWIKFGWPENRVETRSMTPGVSMLWAYRGVMSAVKIKRRKT